MKRLFCLASAMLMCVFAFLSCEDDKNDDLKGGGSGRESGTFLPMDKQITAFNDAFIQAGDDVDFSGLGQATSILLESFAADSIDVMSAFEALKADERTAAKMKAVTGDDKWKNDFKDLFERFQEGSLDEDGILDVIFGFTPVDLSDDIYFGVDLEMVDSVIDGNKLLKKAVVKNINHDVDDYVINIASSGHEFSFSFDIRKDEIDRIVVTDKTSADTAFALNLPQLIDVAVKVDGQTIMSYRGNIRTNFVVDGKVEQANGMDTLTSIVVRGTTLQTGAKACLGTNTFNASVGYDETDGIFLKTKVSGGDAEIFSANVGIKAELSPSLNWKNTMLIGMWAMSNIESVTADAKLGGDKISIVAGFDQNPVTALLSVATSTKQEEILEVVDTLNAHFTCNIFFKGYDEAQAKIKLAQKTPKEILPLDEGSFFDNLTAGIANSGVYFAVETFDKDGNVITMPADKYFTQIDMKSFQQSMSDKFNGVFSEMLAPLFGVDPEDFDLTDLIMQKLSSDIPEMEYK